MESNPQTERSIEATTLEHMKKLRARVGPLKLELRRHFLTGNQRVIAETVLELSYGRGLSEVIIPNLGTFGFLTGIAKPHVLTTLRELNELRIVRVRQAQGHNYYRINGDSESWKVRAKVSLDDLRLAMSAVDECNGIHGLASALSDVGIKDGSSNEILFPGVTEKVTVTDWTFPEIS